MSAVSHASTTPGAQSSQSGSRMTPIRSAPGSPAGSSSPNRTESSSRQSEASRVSAPETIVSVTSARWWPAIAERPKVGFSPVSPQ